MLVQRNRRQKYTSTGRPSGYQVELYHKGLNEAKALSAPDDYALDAKIHHQAGIWDQKWKRAQSVKNDAENVEFASSLTTDYQTAINECENILRHTLSVDDAVDWNTLKRTDSFVDKAERKDHIDYRDDGYPTRTHYPSKPLPVKKPSENEFAKEISFFDQLFGGAKKKRAAQAAEFNAALGEYEEKLKRHQQALIKHDRICKDLDSDLEAKRTEWAHRKEAFDLQIRQQHDQIDQLQKQYDAREHASVVEYCELVLSRSNYPFEFDREVSVTYLDDTKVLGIDFLLPKFENLPAKQSARYIKSNSEFSEKLLSHAARTKLFDSVLLQIAIRTLHELFEADTADAIDSIAFNGWVDAASAATGHVERKCVLSVHCKKSEFLNISLEGICDNGTFKECFRSLKGVSAAKLSTLTPIKPVIEFNKTDKRFTDHYEVASQLDSSVNLASMDWEDFEHLVRELFEKEFSVSGGEVRVTQASRDGGVDAVAFDPDPIRGGKIVIQAKRYTNVVGVSAVRDLYGTVMNEGANKGILVTTSQYGSDAYQFANGKPITLLDGSNLLHLLHKHGHEARIDIAEAKRLSANTTSS